mmetsp:Transcript_40838/g.119224  ORF Transcript_40838/g.119224 Transcript_40838/m.119224 type:complete len:122 (-) Transcript_40838:461-826(-)
MHGQPLRSNQVLLLQVDRHKASECLGALLSGRAQCEHNSLWKARLPTAKRTATTDATPGLSDAIATADPAAVANSAATLVTPYAPSILAALAPSLTDSSASVAAAALGTALGPHLRAPAAL